MEHIRTTVFSQYVSWATTEMGVTHTKGERHLFWTPHEGLGIYENPGEYTKLKNWEPIWAPPAPSHTT